MSEKGMAQVALLNLSAEHGLTGAFNEAMEWAREEGREAGRAEAFEEARYGLPRQTERETMKFDLTKLFVLAHTNSTLPPLRKSPSPIPCGGYEINTPDAHEYDCKYDHAPECERCVVNAGPIDPRTGKRYRKPKAKP